VIEESLIVSCHSFHYSDSLWQGFGESLPIAGITQAETWVLRKRKTDRRVEKSLDPGGIPWRSGCALAAKAPVNADFPAPLGIAKNSYAE